MDSLNQLARFGTPLLLFISTYLMFGTAGNRPFDARRFVSRRFRYVVLPFLFVSLIQIAPYVRQGQFLKVGVHFVTGGGSHLFFVPLMIQVYALYVLLRVWARPVPWRRLLLPSLLVSLSWSISCMALGVQLNRWQWLLPTWLPFIVLGALCATEPQWLPGVWRRHGRWLIAGLILAASVVALQLHLVAPSLPSRIQVEILSTSRGPTVVVYALLLITWWVAQWPRLKEREIVPLVGLISSRSFGIYLIHPYVNRVLSEAFTFVGAPVLLRAVSVLLVSLALVCLIGALPGGSWLVGNPGPSGITPGREQVPA
ncbi:Acyltransferase family protein [compost metagenome]